MQVKQEDQPFRVVIQGKENDPSGFHSGWAVIGGAQKTAEVVNQSAKEMGLKVRYVAIPKS